jgi:uncharacterized protein YuzE
MVGAQELKIKYDREADVLYCSFGDPRPALSMEVGEGVVVRHDPATEEVVGITIVDFFRRFADHPEETVHVPLAASPAQP